MKVGDRLKVRVDSLAYGGDGVGRVGNFVVFVSGGLPEEECQVVLKEVHKHYARAVTEEVLQTSPDRTPPPCPVFGICGGCQWQMLSYSAQLEAKRRLIWEALERIGDARNPEVEPALGMEDPWRFRNKAQFPVARKDRTLAIGYYRRGTHDLVEFEACLIQDPALDRFRKAFKALWEVHGLPVYDEESHAPGVRHLVGRVGQGTKEVLVTLVLSQGQVSTGFIQDVRKALPELVGIVLNLNPKPGNAILGKRFLTLWGRGYLYETIGPLRLRTSAGSFFQTNTRQTEVLYKLVKEMAGLSGGERIVDLYSGVGGIALILAPEAERVVGIEEGDPACRDAYENSTLNGIVNIHFHRGRVEKYLSALQDADVVIADPPRSGCSSEVLSALAKSRAHRLIYVSCNPTTLARDIGFLVQRGFLLSRVIPVDLFPHSYHIEAAARLDRQ